MNKTWKLWLLAPMLLSCGGQGAPEADVPYLKTIEWDKISVSESLGEGKIRLTDMVGRQVDLEPGSYNRVICIGAGALRLYSYIGDTDKVCAVEDIDNLSLTERPKMFDDIARPYVIANQEKFSRLPSCGVGGPANQKAETEKIISCQPDIIFSEYEDADKSNTLQAAAGVPVITLKYGSGNALNATMYGSLLAIGKAMNRELRAKELVTYCNDSVKTIYETTKAVSKKKAYIAGLGRWGTTNAYSTSPNYEPFVYANADNVVKNRPTPGIQDIDKELFITLAPEMDVMFFDAAAIKNIKGQGFDFSSCPAFQTGEVYLQMGYNVYYTNVEISLINCWFVAKSLYPNLFDDFGIAAKADEILCKFLGKNLYSTICDYPLSYGGYQKIADPAEFFA